jgi:hypothetical protein
MRSSQQPLSDELLTDELERRLAAITSDERDRLFRRTALLGYEARQKGLAAEENAGEAAITVDPIESPLWYVEARDGYLSDPEDPERLIAVLRDVIGWTNAIVTREDGRAAALAGFGLDDSELQGDAHRPTSPAG